MSGSRMFGNKLALLPVPRKPEKPYNPLPEPIRKRVKMTLAAGFRCRNGVVLCADRLLTHGGAADPGSFAHYGKKVFTTGGYNFCAGLCACAGDATQMQPLSQDFFDRLEQRAIGDTDLKLSDSKAILEQSLNELADKINAIPSLQMLVAVTQVSRGVVFLKSNGLLVSYADPVEILGIGEQSLVRYLVDAAHPEKLDIQGGAALAVAVVWAAKKYCPQYCGGDTDVLVIPKGSEVVLPLTQSETYQIEELFTAGREGAMLDFLEKGSRILSQSSFPI